MILYYAMGGGLGHISRTSAFISQLGLEEEKIILLTSSRHEEIVFKNSKIKIIKPESSLEKNPDLYLQFLLKLFEEYAFQQIYMDVFPYGIQKEFLNPLLQKAIQNIPLYYIARIIQWDAYKDNKFLLRFQKTYLMESIDPSQLAWIKENSEEMQELEIEYPKSALPEEILEKLTNLRRKNQELWLLVHSEPLSEVLELIQYADEMSRLANRDRVLLVASIEKPEVGHIHWIPVYPARALFPYVDKIITACGFNLMQETKAYREKHHYMPFKRKWDDQWLRARLAGTFRII